MLYVTFLPNPFHATKPIFGKLLSLTTAQRGNLIALICRHFIALLMLFYQKRSVPFRFVSFDGLFNWALPEAHISPPGAKPVNRQQFYAGSATTTRNLPWETFPFVKIPVLIGTYEMRRVGIRRQNTRIVMGKRRSSDRGKDTHGSRIRNSSREKRKVRGEWVFRQAH